MHWIRFRDPAGSVRRGEWVDGEIHYSDETYYPEEVDVLAPVEPSKIVCQAGGYQDHRDESDRDLPDRPDFFLKTSNCVSGHQDTVPLPNGKDTLDFEAELGVVIGQECKRTTAEDAMEFVEGFTCVNDISNRDDQQKEKNWVRGKSFDSSAPIGPVVATPDEVPPDASLELRLNGDLKQESDRSYLIFTVPELIEEITELMTLYPGDVIATGTPYGPGPLKDGDRVEIEIEGVGTLVHFVERR
jgi:2-keto-4-pentenoate hydratase/2-oxohepta-3-ene-1,7-dioic acid hydratase in catechol pathway